MAYDIQLEPRVRRYLKKVKDVTLKRKFVENIYGVIAVDPYAGNSKSGDLKDCWTVDFFYAKTQYRIAYSIEEDVVAIVILAGTHEGFYEELKRSKRS